MEKSKKNNIFKEFVAYFLQHKSFFIVFCCVFFVLAIISFLNVSTSQTVASFNVLDYEKGQISDRTIVSQKALPEDAVYPFSIYKDEIIIKKGFPVTEQSLEKLKKMSSAPLYIDYRSFANSLLFFILLASLSFFLFSRSVRHEKTELKEQIFLSIIFIIVYVVTVFMARFPSFVSGFTLPVVIPAAFALFLITVLFGQNSAVSFSFILSFGILYAYQDSVVPSIFVLCSSLAAVRIMRSIRHRMDMVYVSIIIGILDSAFLFALRIIFNEISSATIWAIFAVGLNGFLSGIVALGFLTPLESMLNTSSVFRLMDLSDLNNPVMRKMLLAAPGTYNHSLVVAQLAEAACEKIGANALLARVGAYYHDMGKMEQPEYFTENQQGENKHDDINPRMSVMVIRSHVRRGVEKAHAMRLPSEVIDIIDQHHGNSLIEYFYYEAKKADDAVSPEEYSYMGNPPTSREAGVVMLADTVEAACRSLENPSVPRLEKFINKLVMKKYEDHQLDKSGLTFADLDTIRESFVTILAGYYHSRVKYPNQSDPDENEVPTVHEK